MGVKEWSERLEEMIRTPQRDYPNDSKETTFASAAKFII